MTFYVSYGLLKLLLQNSVAVFFFFCHFFLNVTTEICIHPTAGTMLKENKEQPFHSQLKAINLTLKTHILYSL